MHWHVLMCLNLREFACKNLSLRGFWVGFGSKCPAWFAAPLNEWENDLGETKMLGAHSECNVKTKVAYVLCFRGPKSLRPHSGDRSFCVFAYLIALLAPRNSTLQYLIALLQPRNSKVL